MAAQTRNRTPAITQHAQTERNKMPSEHRLSAHRIYSAVNQTLGRWARGPATGCGSYEINAEDSVNIIVDQQSSNIIAWVSGLDMAQEWLYGFMVMGAVVVKWLQPTILWVGCLGGPTGDLGNRAPREEMVEDYIWVVKPVDVFL